MSRPYSRRSLDQLEKAIEAAEGDESVLDLIRRELEFRRTPRARELSNLLGATPMTSTAPTRPEVGQRPPIRKIRQTPKIDILATAEQVEAVVAFTRGGSLKINAYAGTGKTSTLQLLAASTSRRGQYIAFNRRIVEDAKGRFPKSVHCATLHSLAFRATPSEYRTGTKMTGSCNANQLAELLGIAKNWRVDEHHILPPRSQGYLILETVRRFTQSADLEPQPLHVPLHGSLVAAKDTTLQAVEEFAVKGARHVWARMVTASDALPLGHDGYLKLWALAEPRILVDFIMLDEAQDTNPVVLDMLRNQAAQMIYVGDRYQQIYEWRGAVNAMEHIKASTTTLLTKSFRFGDTIANAASRVLSTLGEDIAISGNKNISSQIGPTDPQAILARTNASAIGAVIDALDANRRPHLLGGIQEMMELLRGVTDLKQGQPSTVPDFFGFLDWESVVAFAKSGEGDHLLALVNLVESRGEKQLMWALEHTVEEEESDLVVSTAHKAKGMEWSRVRLMDDFLRSSKIESVRPATSRQPTDDSEEIRLLYVAITRAREELEIPGPLAARFGIRCEERTILAQPSSPRAPAPVVTPWKQPYDWEPSANPSKKTPPALT